MHMVRSNSMQSEITHTKIDLLSICISKPAWKNPEDIEEN